MEEWIPGYRYEPKVTPTPKNWQNPLISANQLGVKEREEGGDPPSPSTMPKE